MKTIKLTIIAMGMLAGTLMAGSAMAQVVYKGLPVNTEGRLIAMLNEKEVAAGGMVHRNPRLDTRWYWKDQMELERRLREGLHAEFIITDLGVLKRPPRPAWVDRFLESCPPPSDGSGTEELKPTPSTLTRDLQPRPNQPHRKLYWEPGKSQYVK